MPESRDPDIDPVHTYGRGTFDAHPNYVAYMESIVDHPNYAEMPGARSDDGRIVWQVSSGKTTSFYTYYEARRAFWVAQADSLGLPGTGNEQDRFSIAARLIHPTGQRACRLCGQELNIGYFYLNANGARRLNKVVKQPIFNAQDSISLVVTAIERADERTQLEITECLLAMFADAERQTAFAQVGMTVEAFARTSHVRTTWLSPGFMANPPDRLDGFHDYCLPCRKANDPGRHDANMRTYNHDRRAFEWWAEGDWALADALYNSAGKGFCSYCGVEVERVSPDHIGPLACGFQQLPLFAPSCTRCNSSKNRRMRLIDIERLLEFEQREGATVASWQVRGLWDSKKLAVSSDTEAAELSTEMRSLQDGALRTLQALQEAGEIGFLVSLLSPLCALYTHSFVDLDPARLTFSEVVTVPTNTQGRMGLAARSVRISLESLSLYAAKPEANRKLRATYRAAAQEVTADILHHLRSLRLEELDVAWAETAQPATGPHEFEKVARELLRKPVPDAQARRWADAGDLLKLRYLELGETHPRP